MKIKEKIYAFIKLQRLSFEDPLLKPLIKFHLIILNKKVSIKKNLLYDVESFLSLKIILSFTIEVLSLMVLHSFIKSQIEQGFIRLNYLENLKLGSFENNAITGATISPDASKVLLLCHGKVWLFKTSLQIIFFSRRSKRFKLNHFRKKI
jgi:hypothetical protein